MAEPGKRFEKNIKENIPGIIRLYDTTNGYAGVANPCDFIYYAYPYMYLLECKSVQGDRFDFSLISPNQHNQLSFHDTIFGETSIILVEFRGPKEIYAIPYKLINLINSKGKKSIHYMKDKKVIGQYRVPATYAKVNFRLSPEDLVVVLHSISEKRGKYETEIE